MQKILPPEKSLSSKQAPLREWIKLAKDETSWLTYIDNYFETCRNIDFEDITNDTPENDEENELEFEYKNISFFLFLSSLYLSLKKKRTRIPPRVAPTHAEP